MDKEEKQKIDYKELVKNKLVNRKSRTGTIYSHPASCACLWCSGKSTWVKAQLPIQGEKEGDQNINKN